MNKYILVIIVAAAALALALVFGDQLDKGEDTPSPPHTGGVEPAGDMDVRTGSPKAEPSGVDLTGIEKAAGGKTVAEVYADKRDLDGKTVVVRGKVVKYTPRVMGKNWLHIRDGSGAEGTNDLTVTTDGEAKIGDTVVVTGTVTLDQDFGFGYAYEILVKDAAVVVE